MRKIDFDVAMKFLKTDKIGTYKKNGTDTELHRWHDYVLYFDEQAAVIIGKFPLPLGYRIFQNYVGNDGFKLLNDDHDEWRFVNVQLDNPNSNEFEEKYFESSCSTGYIRIYSIPSLKDLLEVINLLTLHEIENCQKDALAKMREKLPLVAAPRIPESTPRTDEDTILAEELKMMDLAINPFQGKFDLDEFEEYTKRIEIDLEGNHASYIRMSITNPNYEGRVMFKSHSSRIAYTTIRRIEELHYQRVEHILTPYVEGDYTSGRILLIRIGLNDRLVEAKDKDLIYNFDMNMIREYGVWREATAEDKELLIDEIRLATAFASKITLDAMMKPGHELKFIPVESK